MKKILILVDSIGHRKKRLARFLRKSLKEDSQVTLGTFPDLFLEIEKGKVIARLKSTNLLNFDLVYIHHVGKYFSLALALGHFLKFHNIRFVDRGFGEVGFSDSKLNGLTQFALDNLPVIPSFYIANKSLSKYAPLVVKKFGYPIFAKNIYKQRREGITVIAKKRDFQRLIRSKDEGFILQKTIKIKDEYRLVVMGENVVALHKEAERLIRRGKVVVDSSESLSSWINPSVAPSEMRDAAIKATKLVGLDISGVDACIEKESGKVYLIEVNRSPGFTQDFKISPELPELVKFFKNLTKV